MSTCPRIFPQE